MSLNSIKNVLSKAEMKNIMAGSGGVGCYAKCACSGMTGSWVYTDHCATAKQASHDVATYCRYGGYCQS